MANLSYKNLFIIITILLIGIVALLRIQQKPTLVQAEWFNEAWIYRQAINISDHSVGETNVYITTSINLSSSTKSQIDNGDFRFTTISGQLLDYYIVSGTGTTNISFHINFDSFPSGAQTIYAYYGNPTADNGFSSSDFTTVASSYTLGLYGSEEKGLAPLLYLKFDEGVGTTAYDSSTNGYHAVFGTTTSAPTWTSDLCVSGKCLTFDGTTDKLTVGSTVTNVNSVSFWVRSSTTAPAIVDFDGGTHYISGSGGTISATGFDSPTIYVNGVVSSSIIQNSWNQITITTGTTFTATSITIGKINTNFLNGSIDEFKIYGYVRTVAQVKLDYNSRGSVSAAGVQIGADTSNSLSNGLVNYWKFDEGIGTTTRDSSGNSNIITLGNATSAPAWSSGKYGIGLSFDGTTDQATANSTSPDIQTISFWMYSSTTAPSIIDFDNGTHYISGSGGTLAATGFVSPVIYINGVKTVNFTINTWSHITITTPTAFTGNTITIGKVSTNFFSGIVDEVRLYNRALSPSEVQKLYYYAPGPVGWWKMDENTGTLTSDSTGNNDTVTTEGSMTENNWLPGKYGSSLNFDGINDRIYDPTPSWDFTGTTTKSFTLGAWFKRDICDGNGRGISLGSGSGLRIGDGSPTDVYFQLIPGGSFSFVRGACLVGTWTHVEGVYNADNSTLYLYWNGRLVDFDVVATSDTSDQTDVLSIGKAAGAAYYDGQIDDVRIYNYARTPAQVVEDMNGDNSLSSKIPLAYYKFDEGYGSVANNSGSVGSTLNAILATGNSSPTWSNDGKLDKALNFDGNDYLSIGSTVPIYSISLWYQSSTTAPSFFDFTSSVNVGASGSFFYGTGITSPSYYVDGLVSSSIGATNTWHHFVMTTTSPISSTALKRIGKSGTRYHSGFLDEIKMYGHPLSTAEIKSDYNQNASLVISSTNQTIGSTTTSLEYCLPGDTTTCTPPIAEWKMDEGSWTNDCSSSTAMDTSGNGHHLLSCPSGTGPTGGSIGKIGKAGKFDSTSINLSAGDFNELDGISTFSLSYWIKISSFGAFNNIFYKIVDANNRVSIQTGGSLGQMDFNIANGSSSHGYMSNSYTLNEWFHIGVVYNGNGAENTDKLKVYVNGIQKTLNFAGTTIPTLTDDNSANLQLGSFIGQLDNVLIYNYARTPAQIAYDYNKGGPIAWWKLDECQGAVANDGSGNNYVGTINIGPGGSQTTLGTCTVGTSAAWTNGATGKANSSLHFDGADDEVSIGSTTIFAPTNSPFSASAWVYLDSFSTNYPTILRLRSDDTQPWFIIFSNQAGFLGMSTGNNANFARIKTNTPSTSLTGSWHHVAVSYNGTGSTTMSNFNLYLDGKLQTNVASSMYASQIQGTSIAYDHGDNEWLGKIDDVRVYNYSLTSTQVKAIYNGGSINFR